MSLQDILKLLAEPQEQGNISATPVQSPTQTQSSGQVAGASTESTFIGPTYSGPVQGPPAPEPVQQTQTAPPPPQEDTGISDIERRQREEQERINREIENLFGASAGFLSQAEQNLRQDLPTTLQEIEQQFGLGQQQLETGRAQTEAQIGEAEQQTRQRSRESEAASRRLFNELQLGGQQRFGGASSAAQAFSELANVEQQRRSGAIARDLNTAMREIENQRVNVERSFQDNLQALQLQRDQSVNNANRDFQNKLLQISQMRAQNEQAKAEARLGALQDLRNQIFQIDLQNRQFEQQLQAQRQAQELAIQQNAQSLAQSVTGAQGAAQTFAGQATTTPQTSLTIGGPGVAQQVTPTGRRSDEDLIGAIRQRIPIADEIGTFGFGPVVG